MSNRVDLYHLEPRDPIVLGDGRSIGVNTMTSSIDVPFPSTLAGLVRTTLGRRADGRFDASKIEALKAQSLVGPLLTRLDPSPELFVPSPADAIFFEDAATPTALVRRRLTPQPLRDGEASDLPDGLLYAGLAHEELRKPGRGPRYWAWSHFENWLLGADDGPAPADLGLDRLTHEERTHVAIAVATRTAIDGALFRTDGVRYAHRTGGAEPRFERYALCFAWSGQTVPTGLVGLGGERRLSTLSRSSSALPTIPDRLVERVSAHRRVRLVLLTPAIFDLGFRPRAFDRARLIACAVGRPVVVSGWDHARNPPSRPDADPPIGVPKPTRRCAPAGSVYWLELEPEVQDIEAWVKDHWFLNVSSNEQDRRDGFGLAVVGAG